MDIGRDSVFERKWGKFERKWHSTRKTALRWSLEHT